MVGGMRSPFSLVVTSAVEHLFGAHHPHGFRVIDREGQAFGIPELDPVGLMLALLGEMDPAGVQQTGALPIDIHHVSSFSNLMTASQPFF
jgi:hypothetical protein